MKKIVKKTPKTCKKNFNDSKIITDIKKFWTIVTIFFPKINKIIFPEFQRQQKDITYFEEVFRKSYENY